MITKVNPKFLMGKVMPDDTFFRVNQKSEMPYHDRVLKYGCGLYFVFKTESTNIKIRYKCHFADHPVRFSKKHMVECSVMGYDKTLGEWYYMNTLNGFKPTNGKSDTVFEVDFAVTRQFDKYQVCLPENGISYDYEIESDKPIEYEYTNNSIILVGSSVAQFCNDCNHMNLCAYMYRQYGLNVATVGISSCHTFQNLVLMNFLKQQKDKMFLVVDVEHVNYSEYDKFGDFIKTMEFLVIDNLVTRTCKLLKKVHPEIISFQPPGNWMYDEKHMNDHGVVEYAKLAYDKYNEFKKK